MRDHAGGRRPDRQHFADDDPRSITVFADLLKPGVIRESYEDSAGETVGTFVRARPLLQKRKQANPAGDRLFLGKCDLLFLFEGRTFCLRATCAVGENAILTGNLDCVRCAQFVCKVDAFRNLTFYFCIAHLNHLSCGSCNEEMRPRAA